MEEENTGRKGSFSFTGMKCERGRSGVERRREEWSVREGGRSGERIKVKVIFLKSRTEELGLLGYWW